MIVYLARKFLFSTLLLLFSFALAASVSAHGFGESIEKEVGDYFVDLTYDPLSLYAGEPTPLSFELFEKAGRRPVEFTDVWVRITKGEESTFTGGIAKARLGETRITLTFPEPGEYGVSLRYQGEKQPEEEEDQGEESSFPFSSTETLAETTIPLTVATAQSGFAITGDLLIGLVAGLILGLLPLPILLRRKK